MSGIARYNLQECAEVTCNCRLRKAKKGQWVHYDEAKRWMETSVEEERKRLSQPDISWANL